MSRTLAQVDARLTAEITSRAEADKALWTAIEGVRARLAALETPAPPSTVTLVPSGPISITSGTNVVIENKDVTGSGDLISVSNVNGLVIRNVHTKGGYRGINLTNCTNVSFEGTVLIEDADYCGLETWSCTGGNVPPGVLTVRRIGFAKDPATSPDGNNAYGIALTNTNAQGVLPTKGWTLDGVTVEDVPLWHGIDTHSGQDITVRNSIIRRCPRPLFITSFSTATAARNVNLDNNQLLEPVTKPGGTSLAAITLVLLNGGVIKNTKAASGYGTPLVYVWPDAGPSTWTDGGGNVSV